MPIVLPDNITSEYFKTDMANNFENITRSSISYKDVLPLDTPIQEVIKNFALGNRTFYFLKFHNKITGLITLGNLNCRQVQVYIFGLICELELTLGNFIKDNIIKNEIVKIISQSTEYSFKKIWKKYLSLTQHDLENNLIEHLYFIHLFNLIELKELNNKLGYSIDEWKELEKINKLRNIIAHPIQSLLNKVNDIKSLYDTLSKIEDLTFRINQLSKIKS